MPPIKTGCAINIIITVIISAFGIASAEPAGSPPSIDLGEKEMARMGHGPARPWSFGLELAAEASFPFKERRLTDAAGGIGYEINFIKSITDWVSLRLTYGRSGVGKDNGVVAYKALNPQTLPLPPDIFLLRYRSELKITRYFVSGQYNAPAIDLGLAISRFYFYGGLGAVNHKTTLIEDVFNMADSSSASYTDRASITKFANTMGGGVILMFTRYTGIDISLGFDLVHAGEEPEYIISASGRHYRAYNYGGTTNLRIGLIALL